MQELQRTLKNLETEEKEMAAQRLSGKTSELLQHKAISPQRPLRNFQTDEAQARVSQHHQQVLKSSFPVIILNEIRANLNMLSLKLRTSSSLQQI